MARPPRALMEENRNRDLEQILKTIRNASANNLDPDYFELLGVEVSTDPKVIKKAYRERAKVCHPDRAGKDGHEACVVLNEAYATLMDEELRREYEVYRSTGGDENLEEMMRTSSEFAEALRRTPYTGEPLSKTPRPGHSMSKAESEAQLTKAVFVDEVSCIGCTMCTRAAPAVFRMESKHGRARVFGQWLNSEDEIQEAIDVCPSDCIHWVGAEQLAPLEYVTQVVITERLNVGLMRAGQGGGRRLEDVFPKAARFVRAIGKETDEQASKQAKV